MDKKILIADDAAFMRMLIKDVLTRQGFSNIIEATDGAVACEKYFSEYPDLVFMDITMPNMTGLEALAEIRRRDPMSKVVMCSAMGQEAIVVDAIRLGAIDFVVKPFRPDRISQVARKVLG